MQFFSKPTFLDKNGNFNNAKFMQLLSDARHALKTGKKVNASLKNTTQPLLLGGISKKEVWRFVNKLASFLNSGVDIKTAFSILHKEAKNPKLKRIIAEIRQNLDHGISISDTLQQYLKYFDPLIIALIQVGEKTGTLPKVLMELDSKLLDSIELQAKIKGALIYPLVLICITLLMVIFMMVFIIPRITASFVKANVEIPALTRAIIALSDFIVGHYVILIISLVGVVSGFYMVSLTYFGQLLISKLSLRLPVFGFIVQQSNVILFVNAFSLLLDSGVLMLEALETTANVVSNMLFKKDIIRIKNEVETGVKLSQAMGLTSNNKESTFLNQYFPEDLVHMVNVGEETGTISKTIQKVGANYQKEIKRYIGNLMTMLEPFIIVFIGAIVGTIVIAIMLPFFNLAKVAQKS